ncbi:hypothetical protein ACHQM5_005782 [Ranunculus cassubicifolius]
MATKTYFGINLGTKNTYLAVLDKGSPTPKLLKKFPSEVVVTNQIDKNDINPKDYFSGFLRLIGRNFDDPIVQKEMNKVPYKIVKGPNGDAWVETSYGKQCSPVKLLEKFLIKIKGVAESYVGGTSISGCVVITFPCRVLGIQLETITDALGNVGIKKGSFVHEFAAAAASYGVINRNGLSVIVDLGSRTLDVTLFQVSFGVRRSFKVRGSPKRDMNLGGNDFDDVVLKYLVKEFKIKEGIDLAEDGRLRKAAEEAKIALSTSLQTEINLANIITDLSGGSKDLNVTLTREKFESLVTDLTEKIKNHCEKCLNKAGLRARDVDEVLLVGGMGSVAIVRRVVSEVFGKDPNRGLNSEEVVALGAAMSVEAGCLGIHSDCLDDYP